jgi:AraC family transcriptional regulator
LDSRQQLDRELARGLRIAEHSMMKPGLHHRAEYERRLHAVLAYIDAHLDESVDLARLARVANFSAFHFHRIFAAHTGETLGSYLTRRRVEQAALRLVSQPRLSVLNVAMSVGFGSPEAFARAFKKHFGCSPSEWKTPSARARLQEESKLGQANRSRSQAIATGVAYTASMNPTLSSSPLRVAVQTRAPVRIAYLRYQGPFGEPVGQFWQEVVYPWMVSNDLLGAVRYGISHDDPLITATGKCRYDAGVEVAPDFVPSENAQIATIPGGLYACTKFKGTSAEIMATWERILREWLPASGYQLDARPYFEYYPSDGEYDEKTGAFSCELCIPIMKL